VLRNRSVLVTGCAGFLGPWLCEQLIQAGARVVGLDRLYLKGSRIHNLASQVEMIEADIRDFALMQEIIQTRQITVIFHLAAQALVGEAAKNPVQTFKDNIEGTWNVLEVARLANAEKYTIEGIVVASSDKAYGDQAELPYLESAPMEGKYPYDVSKSCADLISRSYFHSFKLPVCITRCGNLYGGGDLNMSRIVPGTIYSIFKNEPPIIRSNGSPVRDYIYVQDAAEAYLTVAERLLSDPTIAGEAFNISKDQPVSVLEITRRMMKIGNSKLEPVVQNTASLEIEKQYLNSKKMREQFNWYPKHNLDQGLKRAFEWYFDYFLEQSNQNQYLKAAPMTASVISP